MNFALVGSNYKETPITELEKIYVSKESCEEFLKTIPKAGPIQSLVILATCNRMEFYFSAQEEAKLEEAAQWLLHHIAAFKKVTPFIVSDILSIKLEKDALTHLLEVSSGVDSMVFGENEILTQVKDAHQRSLALKATDAALNKIFSVAITAGKRVRAETLVSRGAYSVSSIAVEAIRDTHLDYFGKDILIVGAGTMGRRVAEKCSALGHPSITLANRSPEKAEAIATQLELKTLPYDAVFENAHTFDIIVTATSSKQFIFYPNHFKNQQRATYMIDLGLPRNVSPEVNEISDMDIVTVTGLKDTAEKNIEKRKGELSKIRLILDEEEVRLNKWFEYRLAHQ